MIPQNFIPGHGPLNAPIALVGEQPGKTEVMKRECFVGPAGRELDNALRISKIPRTACYITNVIKDLNMPLNKYIEITKKGVIVYDQGKEYIEFLKKELEYINPNVVVAVGSVALYALTDRLGIYKWRGSIIESSLVSGLKVIPTIHPATIIPPKNVVLNKHLLFNDLVRARNESGSPLINLTPRRIHIRPDFYQCLEFLERVIELGRQGQIMDFDIEVVREELSCISFDVSEYEAICIPFTDGFNDYFTIDQEERIMKKIAEFLEDPMITKRNQNIAFDIQYMYAKYGIITQGDLHDTMVAQKIIMPDYPAGLDFITSIHTDIPYYKADGKKYFKVGGNVEKFWMYNGTDSIAVAASFPSQVEDLTRQNNIATYDRQRRIIHPLIFMSAQGIKIDLEGMKKKRKEAEDEIVSLEAELNNLVGHEFNWNSPQQACDYFYRTKKETPYKKRNQKGQSVETCDVNALKRLIRKGYREAAIIKKLRNLKNKVLGTYTNLEKIDPDGRYRSYYNPAGADTGRLSSSQNIITETGGNQQNIPHNLLEYWVADEGYVLYDIDLSQIENRIVAYVGRIPAMIEAFETNSDVHSLTAALIFGKPVADITDEDGTCELGDGSHSERFWGKKANHGLNYDLGYKTFALYYEIPEQQARWIVESYHKAYPEVRQNFHGLVKQMLQQNRTVTNLMGRNRVFMGELNDSMYKTAYAQIPQSTTADIINERGLNFIWYNPQWFKHLRLMAQVHDAIYFQIPLSLPWTAHAEMILRIKESLETPLEFHGRKFKIPADLSMGLNMYKEEMKDWKSRKIPNDIDALANILRGAYNDLTKTVR